MRPTNHPTPVLLDLARAQAGVLARGQCLAAGLSRHSIERLTRDRWTVLSPGIYCVTSPTWLSTAWAGILIGGDTARVGMEAAAHLHGLRAEPEEVAVWIGAGSKRRCAGLPLRFLRGQRHGRGEPPRSDVETTILDLAGERTADELVELVASALRCKRTTPKKLRQALAERQRLPHRTLLTDLVAPAAAGVESPLEWRFLRDVVTAHGLPQPLLQSKLMPGTRSDAYFADHGVVAELDGHLGHEDQPFRDMRRDNRLLLRGGLVTLRYGWADVAGEPCDVAAQLAEALMARGWTGPAGRCRNCRRRGPV